MRLGGPILKKFETPGEWIHAVHTLGYRAVFCPLKPGAPVDQIKAFSSAASKAGIVIAEVGAWSSPLSPDSATQIAALTKCKESLALADEIGARCCVNIAGSRGEPWNGPFSGDLTKETFEMIVETVREIIDDVSPIRTYYALESMPWMYPDSTDSYLALFKAIDRPNFGVHFDPVNLINSPQRYFGNTAIIKDFVERLGPHIKSCHAKDILLQQGLTVHLDEVRPGCGQLDYQTFLGEIARLPEDTPVLMEHLPNEKEYALAANHIRGVAKSHELSL
jgi:sugar phosphate isomerase/epimerase